MSAVALQSQWELKVLEAEPTPLTVARPSCTSEQLSMHKESMVLDHLYPRFVLLIKSDIYPIMFSCVWSIPSLSEK